MFLKSQIFNAIQFKTNVRLPLSYWVLVLTRFLLTLLPQRGYIHPDEFFQTVEVIAGDILIVDHARTWEFNPKFPVRNIFMPKMVLGPPIHFIRLANPYFKYYLNVDLKTPYYLLVIPRLFICFLSLINDYCLYRICVIYGQNFKNRLKIFASSYVVLVYCTRSFSNTFEMMFFSILLYLVAECMMRSDKVIYHDEFLQEKYDKASNPVEKVKLFKLRTHLPVHSLNRVIILSSVVAVGVFGRPTFIGFAFVPIFFWLHRGLGSKVVGFKDFHYRFISLVLCSVPTAFILVVVDSVYYGYLTNADVENLKISWRNWVVTPLNFLLYNMDKKNLQGHGLHPWWFHAVINVPLLFNVLGVLAFIGLAVYIYRFIRGQYNKLPRIQSITGLMIFSLVTPVALLSLFPHQEPRFIIPVLVPMVYLFGNQLYETESDGFKTRKLKKVLRCVWYMTNILLTIFYGFVHQGGIYPVTRALHKEVQSNYGTHIHVLTTHTYSMPEYLLQKESTTKIWTDRKTGRKYKLNPSTFIYKFGTIDMDELWWNIDQFLSGAEELLHDKKKKYRFYLVAPCTVKSEVLTHALKYPYIDIKEDSCYYPHFSSEAMPRFPDKHDQFCLGNHLRHSKAVSLNIFQRAACFVKQFCLQVYTIKPNSMYLRG